MVNNGQQHKVKCKNMVQHGQHARSIQKTRPSQITHEGHPPARTRSAMEFIKFIKFGEAFLGDVPSNLPISAKMEFIKFIKFGEHVLGMSLAICPFQEKWSS